jgi:hypothetical protein
MDRAFSTYGREGECMRGSCGKTRKKITTGQTYVDGRILIKLIY